MNEQLYWIYILSCENNSYYAGYTTDLVRRLKEHLKGTAKCKYTRSFKPVSVAQCWQVCGNKSLAMKIEKYIKKISKKEKIRIIKSPDLLTELFECKSAIEEFEKIIEQKGLITYDDTT